MYDEYKPILSIGRGHEVRIVESAAILCVRDHGVVFLTASLEVELLEVTGSLGETIASNALSAREQDVKCFYLPIEEIMNHVAGIE